MRKDHHIAFDTLLKTMDTHADRYALYDKDGAGISYKDFKGYISGAWHQLDDFGIQKGDKILIAVPMSLELYAIIEAIFAKGATAIFLDPWMKGKNMEQVVRKVKPSLFIVTKKLSRVTWLLTSTWSIKKWRIKELTISDKPYEIADVNDDDNALITFTSGTSGEPKGANRTFGFVHAQEKSLRHHIATTEPSVDYTNFPIVGLVNFTLGNTVVIPKINLMKIHEVIEDEVLDQITANKVTRLIVSPALLRKVLPKLPEDTAVKEIITGGAPVSIPLVKDALKQLPRIEFKAIYGSTEAEPICIANFTELAKNQVHPLDGVYTGIPVDDIELKIIRPHEGPVNTEMLETLNLPKTETGEIIVTGEHVNKNYYQNEAAFLAHKITDKNGVVWHRTGDIGYFKNDGLFLVGRKHRIMGFNGKSLHPYPIEQFVEVEFHIPDNGYICNDQNEFCLFYHSLHKTEPQKIKTAFEKIGYPLDLIIRSDVPLPRDSRHGSKLQIDKLKITSKKRQIIRFNS